MSLKKLAVLTTHPIQYQAPWFRAMAAHPELDLQVFFCHRATQKEQAAAGFGVEFSWDVPLLEGYSYRFLKNVAKNPQLGRYAGLDTPEIKNIIARERYDALLVCGWHFKSAWQAIRACWRTKTPVMVRGDSHLRTLRHPLKKLMKSPLYSWFIPKLDACLAVGKWSQEYYLHYGANPERIFFVPHNVDNSYFAQESARLLPQRAELRKGWKLSDEAVVFLFAGKFIEKKRPMDFVEAVSRAARGSSKIMGLMVGDGPLRESCEVFAQQNDVPICFAGFLNQSQIIRAYVAADVLVLPSDGETWGLVVNEAMSCGRPCVVSNQVGSGPDMVINGKTGAIFPMGDVDSLTGILESFAADRSSLRGMGEHSLEMAERYSTKVAVDGIIKALDMVAHR
jgi:glycosyltransferase involved in cell wall biosynthesis